MTGITTHYKGQIITITVDAQINLNMFADFINKNMSSWGDKSVIWNLTYMDFFDILNKDITEFIYKILTSLEGGKCKKIAIIAPTNVQFGMMMVFKAYVEATATQVKIEVYRDHNKVENWLTDGKEIAPPLDSY